MASYLDGAAFDDLYSRRGCSAGDIARLRKRVYARELSVPLSLHHLEEILLDRRARPELKVAKTKLMLSIGNFRRMTKPCASLLHDELSAAARGESARLTIDAATQNVVSEGLGELIETDGEELSEELVELLEGVRTERIRMLEQIHAIGALISPQLGAQPSQSDYLAQFRSLALGRVLRLSESEQSTAAGIESGRAALFIDVAAALSRSATPAALESLPHALAAIACADEFVTNDAVLSGALSSLESPLKISGLAEFLQSID